MSDNLTSTIDPPALAMEYRRKQYEICRQRGHAADWAITVGYDSTKKHCKYCGTLYWIETIEREEGAPDE